jgi:16S rRNA G527 N7-methylase RsmG
VHSPIKPGGSKSVLPTPGFQPLQKQKPAKVTKNIDFGGGAGSPGVFQAFCA